MDNRANQELPAFVLCQYPGDNIRSVLQQQQQQQQSGPRKKYSYVPRSLVQHNYHDWSGELPPVENTPSKREKMASALVPEFGSHSVPFPLKLHRALEAMRADGLAGVCSWQPHGRAFVVHRPRDFASVVLPRYFGRMKLSSFQRQLNLYGFVRLTQGPDRGGYYHELFLRGREFLCRRIRRTKVKGTGTRAASNPDDEPNLYDMPPINGAAAAVVQSVPPLLPKRAASLPNEPRDLALLPPTQMLLPSRVLSASLLDPGATTVASASASSSASADVGRALPQLDDPSDEPDEDMDEAERPPAPEPVPLPEILEQVSSAPTAISKGPPPQLDGDVVDFLRMLFEKDAGVFNSSESSDSNIAETKGIPVAAEGSKNAASFAHHRAFRQKSMRNAAA